MASRSVKKVSLNEPEMNSLWLPLLKTYGELGDSALIKKALKDSKKYNIWLSVLEDYGVDLDKLLEKLK